MGNRSQSNSIPPLYRMEWQNTPSTVGENCHFSHCCDGLRCLCAFIVRGGGRIFVSLDQVQRTCFPEKKKDCPCSSRVRTMNVSPFPSSFPSSLSLSPSRIIHSSFSTFYYHYSSGQFFVSPPPFSSGMPGLAWQP